MKAYLIFAAFLVLMSGVVFAQLQRKGSLKVRNEAVLSEDAEEVNEIQKDVAVKTEQNTPTYDQNPTNFPSPSPTMPPTEKGNLGDFKYPSSEVLSSDSKSYLLKTSDSPDAITNWYKEKIRAEKMNVKTFVTTKTNDDYLSKLVGAENGLEVRVEVKRGGGEAFTQISVSLDLSS